MYTYVTCVHSITYVHVHVVPVVHSTDITHYLVDVDVQYLKVQIFLLSTST